MLIRSQDKARLINLNNVEKVCAYGMINNGTAMSNGIAGNSGSRQDWN